MPELTAIHLGLLVLTLVSGFVFGWLFFTSQATKEKIAINAGWQEQLESQQSEHGRLAEQNKGLMEQINQHQRTSKEAADRADELTTSLNESFGVRDKLQQKISEYRSSLQLTAGQRDKFQAAFSDANSRLDKTNSLIEQKEEKISRLKRELENWAKRLPPLVEKFNARNEEITKLELELGTARARIGQLEKMDFGGQTRVEPLSADALPEGLDASNEAHNEYPQPADSDAADERTPVADFSATTSESSAPHDETEFGDNQPATGEHFVPYGLPAESDANVDADAETGDTNDANSETEQNSEQLSESGDASALNGDQPAADDRDDLQRIKGIGPAIEKTLNNLGVWRFSQIVEMSEYDIDRVAQHLKGFRSRIYREDWLGQARDLQYQKRKHPI